MEPISPFQSPGESTGTLIPHLFRREFTRIVAVLSRLFGIEHIGIAEDIAGETFLSALEIWPYRGIPANPTAWLYAIAKNKARNYLHRDQIFKSKVAPALKRAGASEAGELAAAAEPEIDLSEANISDSQLRMLFAVCHPSLPAEGQICLALRILCGFGIEEIATAFLTNKETINKRLFRAREKLRTERAELEFPQGTELTRRLEPVLLTLYLLYNEGYYSESQDTVLREDLCAEAMRLTELLLGDRSTQVPAVDALFSLMCFHASRFPARKGENGEMILYGDQDESRWDRQLIARGAFHLHRASQGNVLTKYHLEASIAYRHTMKPDTIEKWENILQLYNHLLAMVYSPVAALNRTFALSRVRGKPEAIAAAEKLELTDNPYYYTLLGALYTGINADKAMENYKRALALARTPADKGAIQRAIDNFF
ncbi:MAG TPA: sigma-70 family RNA polymerase sigma factor [Puia sp.]|uniref:RNA polymerase sigma factor n=1 Tax=Puia sp. TaxID=2045100 RepID=UPI002C553F0F|nr:sigma-70 family RNA polymerase sigma factor [Puia sp.]HVU93841.1 sigma-70 family RNA polymerase sigma factor [Puia sp.]